MGPDTPAAGFPLAIQSLCDLMRSQRVADMALTDPIWKTSGISPDYDLLARSMDVRVQPRSDVIEVSCTASNPASAATAVTAVIDSVTTLLDNEDSTRRRYRSGILNDRDQQIASDLSQTRAKLKATFAEFGSDDLQPFRQAAAQRLAQVESALTQADIDVASQANASSVTTMPAADVKLSDKAKALEKLRDDARREVVALGRTNAEIQELQREELNLAAELKPVTDRLQALRMEESLGGGLAIISTGEIPIRPEPLWEGRHVRGATALGGAAGLLFALVVVKLRRSD